MELFCKKKDLEAENELGNKDITKDTIDNFNCIHYTGINNFFKFAILYFAYSKKGSISRKKESLVYLKVPFIMPLTTALILNPESKERKCNMLKCNHLQKIYQKKYVVNDLGFSVEKGEVFALLGSNGAGKTTTIKMTLGLIPMDGGKVEKQEGIRIGYSPETPYFHPFLTEREVLEFYGGLQGISKKQLKQEIPELLHRVGLEESNTKVRYFSKGMLQRLALAQALLGNPELLILDEPTAGMDALGRLEMMHMIQALKQEGRTIVMNSHILNDIERVCDRGIIMKSGSLVYQWKKGEREQSLEEIFVEQIGGTDEWVS